MASLSRDKNRNGYRLQFRDANKRKRSMWLGDIPELRAQQWLTHVSHLLDCAGEPPARSTTQWIASLADAEHAKLSTAGLAESRVVRQQRRMTLSEWLTQYINERADLKDSTKLTLRSAQRCLLAYFGEAKPIRSIAKDDAKRWRIWLATQGNRRDADRDSMADETVRRRTGIAKQFFAEALERGLVDENPFSKLPCTTRGNAKRQVFVSADWILKCIEEAPDEQWRTILALARFGGLRVPSELVTLRWSDIDLPSSRMTIRASKTEHHATSGIRVCPVFPELMPFLEAAWDAAPEGEQWVVWRYRRATQNLRQQFERIILRAGLTPWPRLFQNLRATRETELLAKHPAKDVASWLGNTVPVAMKHYAMATEESFNRAIVEPTCGSTCGSISTDSGSITSHHMVDSTPQEKPKTPVFSGVFEGSVPLDRWAILDSNQ